MQDTIDTLETQFSPDPGRICAALEGHPLREAPVLKRGPVVQMIVDHLKGAGARYVFGVSGGAIAPFYAAVERDRDMIYVTAKHESGAAFMADGFARVSGSLGVSCSTAGPGATNAITGVACAYADSIPLLMITGQVSLDSFGRSAMQESSPLAVDIVSMFASCTSLSAMIHTAPSAERILQQGLRATRSGRHRPVHLNLPIDVGMQEIDYMSTPPKYSRGTSRPVDLDDMRCVAKLLLSAQRPCILAGFGIHLSAAWEPLRELAERRGIPVATTPKAKGVFPEDHPLSLGVFGYSGHALAEHVLLSEQTDLLLVIGSSLGAWQTNGWDPRIWHGRTVIHIDIDPDELGRNDPSEVGVVADAQAALRSLVNRLPAEPCAAPAYLHELRRTIPRYEDAELMSPQAQGLAPQAVMAAMNQHMPADAILFVDIGNCITWAIHYLVRTQPNSFHINLGFVSMGHVFGAAIGGQLAAPDRKVIALAGDGALAMNGLELHTAVELGLPIVWVILNNSALGMTYHGDNLFFEGQIDVSTYGKMMDIAKFAESMGAKGVIARNYDEFCTMFSEALSSTSKQPIVIDVRVDLDPCPHPIAARVRDLKGA